MSAIAYVLDDDLQAFELLCVSFDAVGSRITCNPPPTDTDRDYLALVLDVPAAHQQLEDIGFETTTDRDYRGMPSAFVSYKRGDINIICTADREFQTAFMAASSVAKRLNLMKKSDRIALFQAVLYRRQTPDDIVIFERDEVAF